MNDGLFACIGMFVGFMLFAWWFTKDTPPERHEKDPKVGHLNIFVEADKAYKEIYENDFNNRKV